MCYIIAYENNSTQMKRILVIVSLFLVIGIGITLSSCSKDKEDDPGNNDVVNFQAREFIGTWSNDPNARWPVFWTFNADGTCIRKYTDFYGEEMFDQGKWNYAKDSKVLVTTLGMEWDIITVTDEYWTGRYYSFNENAYVTYTYVKIK